MGILDDLKKANPSVKPASAPSGSGNAIDALRAANPAVQGFNAQGYVYQNRLSQFNRAVSTATEEEKRAREYHPLQAFGEGWKSHDKEKTQWTPSGSTGETLKETWGAFRTATEDLSVRAETAFRPAIDAYMDGEDIKKADVVAGIGSLIVGGINVAFSPVTGFLKGAESVPVIGHAASLFNKLAYGLGGAGAETFGEAIESAPFLDDETKAKLRPVTEEIGGLVGLIFGFKAAGKITGKIANTRIVRSRIDALERKTAEIGQILSKDPRINAEVARFVAEHGPVRTLPVTSETPGAIQIPASPGQKHAAYSEKMGYEPYTPDAKLPVIDAGTGGGGGGAPSRVSMEGLPVIDATGSIKPYQEPLPIPRDGVFPATPTTTTKRAEPVRGSTAEVQPVPGKQPTAEKPDVVSVNNGTYQLQGKALTDYQSRLEAHNKRMTQLQESYQTAKGSRREYYGKQLKAEGMTWSAYLRDITGNVTPTELKKAVERERSAYVGKEVTVEINGKKVKATVISKPSYGKVKVRLKNGKEVTVKITDIKDTRTTKQIEEEVLKREEVTEYDPTKEEPTKRVDERDITVEPLKEAPLASPEYNQILIELELAEKGERIGVSDKDGYFKGYTAKHSTFPNWLPENARRKSILDKYLEKRNGTTDDANITYKEGSVLDALDKAVRKREQALIQENQMPIMESTVNGKPITDETIPDVPLGEQTYGGGSQTTGGIGLPQAIQGSGPTRTPSVTRRAIDDFADETAKNMDIYKEADPRYGQMNLKEDSAIAHSIVENNPSEALDLAFGLKVRNDVTNVSVWRVLIEKADQEGNTAFVLDLARSPVAQLLVRGGQEAVALRGLGKFNAAKVIADIEATKTSRFEKRKGKTTTKQVEEDVSALEKSILDTVRNDPAMKTKIIKFLKDIQCK